MGCCEQGQFDHAVVLIEPLGLAVGGERDSHAAGEEAFEEAAEEHRIHHVGHLQSSR